MARQLESRLDRLQVDAIDLYLAHEFDPDVAPEEVVGTFEGLAATKLIKAWGVSNYDADQLRTTWTSELRPSCRTRTRCSN